ncbi:MAG TPA: DUF3575 domain-containing protein [Flavipsychrobacter sp.]|nr:DUF3575 domain-containing protein [Flavipsychrobacter sp.]
MKYVICLLLLCFFHVSPAKEGRNIGRGEVGLNLATLSTGIPELQAGFFIKKHFGVVVSGGYHLHPHLSLNKKGYRVSIIELRGPYYRLGVKGRYIIPKMKRPNIVWLHVSGVYTSYNETYFDNRDTSTKSSHGSGIGFSFATGTDFNLAPSIDLRIGFQTGWAPKFKDKVSFFTPGFGWSEMPIQIVVGCNFRFDVFRR